MSGSRSAENPNDCLTLPVTLQAHVEEDKTFVLLDDDDDDDDDEEEKDDYLEDEADSDVHDATGCADVAHWLVCVCNCFFYFHG